MDTGSAGAGRKILEKVEKIKNNYGELIGAIVASYEAEPETCHIEAGNLPSREGIIEIIHLVRELLFPGYFDRRNHGSGDIASHVGFLLDEARGKLQVQICSAFRHQAAVASERVEDIEKHADEIAHAFLATIPKLRSVLATDVHAALDGDPAAADTDEIIFSYPGLIAITVYRIAREIYMLDVPLIPRIMTEWSHSVTGIDIHAGAVIGEHFFIDHGTGVVIGETTVIGNYVKIYQGVTLGALSTRAGRRMRNVKRHPTLEDHVTVYAGASILGGETVIGAGAVISSNVFITKSVPSATRVTVKNPELQYRDQMPQEFKQESLDWVI